MRRFTYHLIYQQLSYRVTVPTIQSVFPPNVLLLVLSSGDQNGFEKRQKLRPLLKEQLDKYFKENEVHLYYLIGHMKTGLRTDLIKPEIEHHKDIIYYDTDEKYNVLKWYVTLKWYLTFYPQTPFLIIANDEVNASEFEDNKVELVNSTLPNQLKCMLTTENETIFCNEKLIIMPQSTAQTLFKSVHQVAPVPESGTKLFTGIASSIARITLTDITNFNSTGI